MARGESTLQIFRRIVRQFKRIANKGDKQEHACQKTITDAERESKHQAREQKKAFLQEEKKAIAMEKQAQFIKTMTLATQAFEQRCMERKILREKIINQELR